MSKKIVLALAIACFLNASERNQPMVSNDHLGKCQLVDWSNLVGLSQMKKNQCLLEAVKQDDEERVNVLIAVGGDVNWADEDGHVPLMWAAQRGYVNLVNSLIAAGAVIDFANKKGRTPLMWAAQGGHVDVVNSLIAAKADVDWIAQKGRTPLMAAAWAGHAGVADMLIAAGADPDPVDDTHRTALMWAAQGKKQAVVKRLLEHLAIPPTEEEMTKAQLSEDAKKLIRDNLLMYLLEKLEPRVVGWAKQFDGQNIPTDLIMLILEQAFGPYVGNVKDAIFNGLKDQ